MTEAPKILPAHHLKTPQAADLASRDYEKLARPAAEPARLVGRALLRASAPPRGWIISSSWRAWLNWN